MANTFVKIATVTVGAGGAATIDFSSIPSTYTDLKLLVSPRSSRAATSDPITVSLNGSTSGITFRTAYGNGTAAGSYTQATDSVAYIDAASSTASTFSNLELYLPNYTSSSNKSWSLDNVWENNATAGGQFLAAGLQTITAAINSITLTTSVGTFVQYSTATLYGIKNS